MDIPVSPNKPFPARRKLKGARFFCVEGKNGFGIVGVEDNDLSITDGDEGIGFVG